MEFTDDDIAWTSVNTGIDGVGGEVISFSGSTSNYHVYYTKSASNNRGETGSWIVFGQTGFETHPNDSAVYGDPIDTNVVYMRIDQGTSLYGHKGLGGNSGLNNSINRKKFYYIRIQAMEKYN